MIIYDNMAIPMGDVQNYIPFGVTCEKRVLNRDTDSEEDTHCVLLSKGMCLLMNRMINDYTKVCNINTEIISEYITEEETACENPTK